MRRSGARELTSHKGLDQFYTERYDTDQYRTNLFWQIGNESRVTEGARVDQNDIVTRDRVEVVTNYLRRVDAGDPSLLDLMTDDVQLYFPKFGVGYGKKAVGEAAAGLMTEIATIKHDFDRMTFITSGDYVVVEGFEGGTTKDGKAWPDPQRSEGCFCNVFVFEGLLIKRVHIYVDPDLTSSDRARFHWGENVRTTRQNPDAYSG
jgi:hypothetical protein